MNSSMSMIFTSTELREGHSEWAEKEGKRVLKCHVRAMGNDEKTQ